MYLLPYQRVTIKTQNDADEIRARLARYVQGITWGLGELDDAPYSGWMGEDRFEIRRVDAQRSPFAPHGRLPALHLHHAHARRSAPGPQHTTAPTPVRPWVGGSRTAQRYATSPPDWIPDHAPE